MRRRAFLGLMGTAGVVSLAGCGQEASGKLLRSQLPLPARFAVPLPIPPAARPSGPDQYTLTQRVSQVEIVPGTKTEVWGYDGVFPGPTFDVRSRRPTTVTIRNELPVPTSTHLHGGVNPHDSDGYPTDLIVPASLRDSYHPGHGSAWRLNPESKQYRYPLDQPAATLWYHDHRMDFTAPQMWRGLAGFFLLRDDESEALGLPSGERDIPLMICDRAFAEDGSFAYPAKDPTLLGEHGVTAGYMQGVQGDVILVNGAPWPQMEVDAARYRLRLLNASNARRYRLTLDRPPTSATAFTQIGSDAGLLAAPYGLDAVTLAPAERFDVIVDFGQYPTGTRVTLRNELGSGPAADVMRFVVARPASDDSRIPDRLAEFEPLSESSVAAQRTFKFQRSGSSWRINGNDFNLDTALATVRLGTTERWTFTSDFHHPIHVHLGHFQVLSRDAKDPGDSDRGWKDTVDLRPYEVVEVLVKFTGYTGRYVLHCHNLEHEDMAMMANFDVV